MHFTEGHRRPIDRASLECVLSDDTALIGGDADMLRRGVPSLADSSAERLHRGLAAEVQNLGEGQDGATKLDAYKQSAPMLAQADERQSSKRIDGDRLLRF